MMAHTPGPWKVEYDPYDDGTPYFRIVAGDQSSRERAREVISKATEKGG